MANSVLRSKMVIGVSFFIALVLQTIPWPGALDLSDRLGYFWSPVTGYWHCRIVLTLAVR